MKKFQLNLLAAGVLALSLGACSSTNTDTTTATTTEPVTTTAPTTGTDATATTPATDANSFPVMAASSDLFETRSSELAGSRALHPAVRIFAKMMRDDHGGTSEELKSLATKKNITLPATMLPVHQRLLEPMSETGIGEKFDKRYMDAQIDAHEEAITVYENAASKEPDAELRAFAGRRLPKLRDHLVMAKKAKDSLD